VCLLVWLAGWSVLNGLVVGFVQDVLLGGSVLNLLVGVSILDRLVGAYWLGW